MNHPTVTILDKEYDPELVSRNNPDPSIAALFDYAYLKLVSHAYGERNDCVVIALCVLSGESYPKVHQILKNRGRRNRCGTQWHTTTAALHDLNLKLHPVTITYDGRTIRSLVPQLPHHLNDPISNMMLPARFLIKAARHVAGVVMGSCEDWSDERGLYVQQVYQVLDSTDNTPPISYNVRTNTPEYRARWSHPTISAAEAIRAFGIAEIQKWHEENYPGSLNLPINFRGLPKTRKFWLSLRARAMARCEDAGLKRTTASIELGKWQSELGYHMTYLQ
jgi:hypothetical protein